MAMKDVAPSEHHGSEAANPYRSPSHTEPLRFAKTQISKVRFAVWLYPLLLIAAFYGTWLIGWLVLGHAPRPNLDDPKSISVLVDLPYFVANLMIIVMPATWVGGLVIEFTAKANSFPRRLALSLVFVLLWIATIIFIRWDPLLVAQWLGD